MLFIRSNGAHAQWASRGSVVDSDTFLRQSKKKNRTSNNKYSINIFKYYTIVLLSSRHYMHLTHITWPRTKTEVTVQYTVHQCVTHSYIITIIKTHIFLHFYKRNTCFLFQFILILLVCIFFYSWLERVSPIPPQAPIRYFWFWTHPAQRPVFS